MSSTRSKTDSDDIAALRARAEHAEEMLRAIRSGEVDALVVDGSAGRQVYTLKGSDYNYRVLMDNISEGALTLSKDGMILFSNRQFAEMVKLPLERVISKNIKEFIQPHFEQAFESMLQSSQSATFTTELILLATDTSEIPVAVSLTSLPASEGNDLCMAITNLQERNEAAALLKDKQDELNQSRKLEAIGRLAGGVAHDFNNLVMGMVGMAQDVCESFPEGDPRITDLQDVVKAGNRAFALTKQLLSFARRQTVSLQNINLHVLVKNTMALLRRLITEDIELEYQLVSPTAWVRSDPTYLEQILVNLCLNARDAMPNGGKITIATSTIEIGREFSQPRLELPAGTYVTLTVMDTGSGMSKETLTRIFEPFFTTKKDLGTGLGLATVYGIVKQTGGDIMVSSEVGVGSTFKVYLPQSAATLPEAERTAAVVAGGSETILVVEDEDIVRRVVVKQLKKQGYRILEAPSAPAALEVLKTFSADVHLLITDVIMPKMNGHELVDAATKLRPHMKVLYVSGYPEEVIAKRGILDTGIAFLDKSSLPSQLIQTVRGILNTNR